MSKKKVGLIVSAIILVILIGLYSVGKLLIVKESETIEGTKTNSVTAIGGSNSSSSNSNSASSQSNSSNSNQTTEKQTEQKSDASNNTSENAVSDIVSNSSRLDKESIDIPDDAVAFLPNEDIDVNPDVYEVKGVVDSIELLESSNGYQSQYRAGITVKAGNKDLVLDYFTTSTSLDVLKQGTDVLLRYQLTNTNAIVIRGVSLAEQ